MGKLWTKDVVEILEGSSTGIQGLPPASEKKDDMSHVVEIVSQMVILHHQAPAHPQ